MGRVARVGAVVVYAGVNMEPIPDSGRLLFQNAPGVPGTSEAGTASRSAWPPRSRRTCSDRDPQVGRTIVASGDDRSLSLKENRGC